MNILFDGLDLRGIRSVVFLVADSLRWDSFQRARTPAIDRWAPRQAKRFSYASWTQPSHACLLSGLLPYESIPGAAAATTYASDFSLWSQVLGTGGGSPHLYPEMCLALMARRCGWRTLGRVAMPVLNESTVFSRGFDDYMLSPRGGNLGSQLASLEPRLGVDRNFVFINAGETHYPYLMPASSLPKLSGAHGTLLSAVASEGAQPPEPARIAITRELMRELHCSQVKGLELLDRFLVELIELLPRPIFLLVTSDHGELFGEEGYFGHGPFFHRALFEVPIAVGVVV